MQFQGSLLPVVHLSVGGLGGSCCQVFANLGGAAKSFGSMSKEAWQVEHLGFNIARRCVAERLGTSLKDAPGPRSNSGEGGQLVDDDYAKGGLAAAAIVQVASGRWMGESPLKYADANSLCCIADTCRPRPRVL